MVLAGNLVPAGATLVTPDLVHSNKGYDMTQRVINLVS